MVSQAVCNPLSNRRVFAPLTMVLDYELELDAESKLDLGAFGTDKHLGDDIRAEPVSMSDGGVDKAVNLSCLNYGEGGGI